MASGLGLLSSFPAALSAWAPCPGAAAAGAGSGCAVRACIWSSWITPCQSGTPGGVLYWQPGLPHVWGGGWSFIATSTCLSALRLALSLLLSSSLTGHCLITPSGINETHTRGSDLLSVIQYIMPGTQVLYCTVTTHYGRTYILLSIT